MKLENPDPSLFSTAIKQAITFASIHTQRNPSIVFNIICLNSDAELMHTVVTIMKEYESNNFNLTRSSRLVFRVHQAPQLYHIYSKRPNDDLKTVYLGVL